MDGNNETDIKMTYRNKERENTIEIPDIIFISPYLFFLLFF